MNLPAQVVGTIILIIVVVGMQFKHKRSLLLTNGITNLLYIFQYLLVGATTGAVVYVVNTARTFVLFVWDEKGRKPSIAVLSILVALAIAIGIYTWQSIYSLLPIAASIATTYGAWQKTSKTMRLGMMSSAGILIVHDYHFGAYVSVISLAIIFSSSLIGYIRHETPKKRISS